MGVTIGVHTFRIDWEAELRKGLTSLVRVFSRVLHCYRFPFIKEPVLLGRFFEETDTVVP